MRLSILTVTGMLAATMAYGEIGFMGPGLYEIMNKKSSRMMALDTKDGTSVIQIVSRSQENQRWVVERGPDGTFFIRSAVNGRALEVTNNAKSTPVVCARFNGGPAQQWRIENTSDGKPFIVSMAGGRYLDVPNGSSQEGLRIQIYDRTGDSNQQFVFNHIDERPDKDRSRRGRWEPDDRDRH